jgi:fructosamine-3-kinase
MNNTWENQLPLQNITEILPVGGGDVNDAYRVNTKNGPYFLLVQKGQPEEVYASEIAGLEDFERAGVTAPKVIDSGEINNDAYLLLSYLEEGQGGSQKELGEMVAKLHKYHQQDSKFGYHLSADFGDVQFNNDWTDSWQEIFIEKRLDVLKDIVSQQGLWDKNDIKQYEVVREVIKNTLAEHHSEPSLLHGDLWAGNYMFLSDGSPALFDPSPLYGDREFDLGATMVFGGFTTDFYDAYNAVYPLDEGADKRIQFYQFYLLFVHLAKFGSIYKSSVNQLMKEIIK